jgi:2-oxoisovalerate dehydrogenase E1 component beta subunit
MEPKRVYRASRDEVPEGEYTIPIGQAKILREARGRSARSVTLLAWSAMVHTAKEAVARAEQDGYDVELIDLRTLMPFDLPTILESVKKTGRVVVLHEAPRTCGFGAELAASIQERAMLHLEAPILRVTGFDTPFPYTLENEYLPDADRIVDAFERVVNF